MSQQALIEALGVDPSVLVSILNDLESYGFAERRRDPDDRRRHIVEMSRRGAAALTRVDEVMSTVEREVFGDLSQDERNQLRTLLGRLRTSPDVQVCAGD
jgi:DNA-binding MarR family transcriptional regulator